MIDLDAVAQADSGSRFDRLVALLIGCVALLATVAAVFQVAAVGEQGRSQMVAARLIADITARQTATSELSRFEFQIAQRGSLLGSIGAARGITGLETFDEAAVAVADAELVVAQGVLSLMDRMARPPRVDGPVDAYARELLGSTDARIVALVEEQAMRADAAQAAGARGSLAVVGLSFAAIAAVMAGLAGILGDGRAGRPTLAAGYVAATATVVSILLAAR